jgi:hypothetical protein
MNITLNDGGKTIVAWEHTNLKEEYRGTMLHSVCFSPFFPNTPLRTLAQRRDTNRVLFNKLLISEDCEFDAKYFQQIYETLILFQSPLLQWKIKNYDQIVSVFTENRTTSTSTHPYAVYPTKGILSQIFHALGR